MLNGMNTELHVFQHPPPLGLPAGATHRRPLILPVTCGGGRGGTASATLAALLAIAGRLLLVAAATARSRRGWWNGRGASGWSGGWCRCRCRWWRCRSCSGRGSRRRRRCQCPCDGLAPCTQGLAGGRSAAGCGGCCHIGCGCWCSASGRSIRPGAGRVCRACVGRGRGGSCTGHKRRTRTNTTIYMPRDSAITTPAASHRALPARSRCGDAATATATAMSSMRCVSGLVPSGQVQHADETVSAARGRGDGG